MKPGSEPIVPFIQTISVIGLGKLGAPMLAIFADSHFHTIGVDLDREKLMKIFNHEAPVNEPGLDEMLKNTDDFYFYTTRYIKSAVHNSDVTFVVVATPSEPSGKFSLQHVLTACEEIGEALKTKDYFHIVVITSTVSPGSMSGPILDCLEAASGKKAGVDFGLVYNPEFIALGTVIKDFKNPDMILIGSLDHDLKSAKALDRVYKKCIENKNATVCHMNLINAEITKLAINTFITTKIAYANMLGTLCESFPGGNVDHVTNAMGTDTRIGSKYLMAGASYGGPCFPRDNRALVQSCNENNVSCMIPEATDAENRQIILDVFDKIKAVGGKVHILGSSYKPGTDVKTESFGTELYKELVKHNTDVIISDELTGRFYYSGYDCVVIATLQLSFIHIREEDWVGKTVIDPWRAFSHLRYIKGVNYIGLGLHPEEEK